LIKQDLPKNKETVEKKENENKEVENSGEAE
jgi:hypothetical protein